MQIEILRQCNEEFNNEDKEFEAWYMFQCISLDANEVHALLLAREIHNELLILKDVKGQVVIRRPIGWVLDLIHVGHLVIPSDQAYHHGIIRGLDYGVWAINRSAAMDNQGVQKRAQHAALRNAGVQGESAWGEVI